MNAIEAIRARILRRRVLATLKAAHECEPGTCLGAEAVFRYVSTDGDATTLSDVRAALAYLAGKGYVELVDRRRSRYERPQHDARLTPKGVDLLEASIPPDPGIEDERA